MAQLDPSDRMRIIIEGKKREEQGYLSIRKQAIDLSISRKAVALWWGRRDELDQIGALLPRWKGNSCRLVHKAFSTHEEKEKSFLFRRCWAQRDRWIPSHITRLLYPGWVDVWAPPG